MRPIAGDFARKRNHSRTVTRSLKAFCLETMPDKFALDFSADHDKAIAKMERAILEGEQFALAMPRGSGKTTLIVGCVIWAILNGHKRYVSLIGADKKAASKLLSAIKVQLETNSHLLRLYPDAVYPVRCLERVANRCKGQHWPGGDLHRLDKRTNYSRDHSRGLFGVGRDYRSRWNPWPSARATTRHAERRNPAARLFRRRRPPNQQIREEPNRRRSTPRDNYRRLPRPRRPGQEISGFCLCTVVEIDDVADQLLDQDKWEEWQGNGSNWLRMADQCRIVGEYANLRAEGLAKGRGLALATDFYRRNRKAMDVGAVVAWESRHTKKELSAIQHAWNLRLKLKDSFWKEIPNEPSPTRRPTTY